MEKIKILLSGKQNIQYYIDAVSGVGAEPVEKYLPEIDTGYDGLILCGGSDIHPKYYNEPIDGSVFIDEKRDETELLLLRAFIDAKKPVFGICRGHQLINVYFGGTLYQHIPEAQLHKSHNDVDSVHQVDAIEKSVLSELYGSRFPINSAHHQAIRDLGEGLFATATWENKYIEAFEHKELPILGVQWHPERTCFSKSRNDTVSGDKIFKYFVDLCREYKNG